MKLPYDIARCGNKDCEVRNTCARWMAQGRREYQLYEAFPGGPDCDGYIPMEENDNALSD